jgi:hypothetical protein
MKPFTVAFVGMLIVILWGGAPQAIAQQAKGEKEANISDDKPKAASPAIARWGQAGELVQYAREYESALAMLTAVQMLRQIRVEDGKERFVAKKTKGGETDKGTTPDKSQSASTRETKKLLAEAKPWAKGDPHLTALINQEMKKTDKPAGGTLGAIGGPYYQTGKLKPRTNDAWAVPYRKGEVAEMLLLTNGQCGLDVALLDENGNLVGERSRDAIRAYWLFLPIRDADFILELQNNGSKRCRYEILTN